MQWESEGLAIETLGEDDGGGVAIEEPGFDIRGPLRRAVLGGDRGFLGGPRGSEARNTNDPWTVLVCGEEESGELGGRGRNGGSDRRGRGRRGGTRWGAIGTMVGPVLEGRTGGRGRTESGQEVDASIRVWRDREEEHGPA